jgi:hypothetical protein
MENLLAEDEGDSLLGYVPCSLVEVEVLTASIIRAMSALLL